MSKTQSRVSRMGIAQRKIEDHFVKKASGEYRYHLNTEATNQNDVQVLPAEFTEGENLRNDWQGSEGLKVDGKSKKGKNEKPFKDKFLREGERQGRK